MASIRAASRVRRSRKAAVAPAALASAKSSAIGREDCRLRAADGLGHGGERPVLLGGRRQRQRARGRARVAADVAHRGFELGPCLWPSIALSGAFMALIRLAFSVSYHVRAGAARRPERRRLPTAIHKRSWGRQRKGGTCSTLPVFEFWKFPTRTKRVPCVCQLTASPVRCPSVFPSAPDMWSKAAAGKMGDLRVVSRYVVLPGGQRINVPSDPGQPPATERPRRRGTSGPRSRARPSRTATKKIMQKAGTTRQHPN